MGGVEEKIASGATPSKAILMITNEGGLFEMGKELTIDGFFHDLGQNGDK